MKKFMLVSAAVLGFAAASQAGVDVHLGFHFPLPLPGAVIISRPAPPPIVVAQPPVYAPPPACAPAPVVVAPAPYCAPRVVYAPPPVYYAPRPVYVRPGYYGHYRHGHW